MSNHTRRIIEFDQDLNPVCDSFSDKLPKFPGGTLNRIPKPQGQMETYAFQDPEARGEGSMEPDIDSPAVNMAHMAHPLPAAAQVSGCEFMCQGLVSTSSLLLSASPRPGVGCRFDVWGFGS